MKKEILNVAAIAAALFCIGWADSLEGLKLEAGKIESIETAFIQEKHLSILKKPLESRGMLYYKAPDSLRWEYTSPVEIILLMHDGKVERYLKTEEGKLEKDDSASLPIMETVLEEIGGWLKGEFEKNPYFTAQLMPGREILLTPKEDAMEAVIQKVVLHLSDRPGILEKAVIYESEDSYTNLIFEDAALNPQLDDSIFTKVR